MNGILSVFEALWRVDALGKVVARLCDHAAQYASAAEAHELVRGYPSLWPGGGVNPIFIASVRARSPPRPSDTYMGDARLWNHRAAKST